MIQGNYNHDIRIISIKKSNDFDGLENVVIGADWILTSNHINYPDTTMETYGQETFNLSPETVGIGTAFINFEDLTEEIVAGWVHGNSGSCRNMKRQHQSFLNRQYLNPNQDQSNLPWSN